MCCTDQLNPPLLPFSCWRGRSNHLRMPVSLYDPARSAATIASQCSLWPTDRGVARCPWANRRSDASEVPTSCARAASPNKCRMELHSIAGRWVCRDEGIDLTRFIEPRFSISYAASPDAMAREPNIQTR